MGISCKPCGTWKGIFAKLQKELDEKVKAEKKASSKADKKATE